MNNTEQIPSSFGPIRIEAGHPLHSTLHMMYMGNGRPRIVTHGGIEYMVLNRGQVFVATGLQTQMDRAYSTDTLQTSRAPRVDKPKAEPSVLDQLIAHMANNTEEATAPVDADASKSAPTEDDLGDGKAE